MDRKSCGTSQAEHTSLDSESSSDDVSNQESSLVKLPEVVHPITDDISQPDFHDLLDDL